MRSDTRQMYGVLVCTTILLILVQTVWAFPLPRSPDGIGVSLYVSPNGNDTDLGTEGAPFQTLERARDAVRKINGHMTGDITVFLRGGTYALLDTLTFSPADSGHNGFNIIFRAYPGESPVVSGGQQITGWQHIGNGLYKANAGGLRFRQLYVNGHRTTRARNPNAGTFYKLLHWDRWKKSIIINSEEIASWSDLNEVEMVIQKEWTQNNLRIGSFDIVGAEAHVTPLEPDRSNAFNWNQDNLKKSGQSYHLENAYEFLDVEGEWYLNARTGDVYYKARSREDMSRAIVMAPRLMRLVKIQGGPHNPVKNIQFHGISFEDSTWLEPNAEGFLTVQADRIVTSVGRGDHRIPAAIHIQNAQHLYFERNVFRNLGSTGVSLWSGVHDNVFNGNVFRDIAASGMSIGMDLKGEPGHSWDICTRNIIRNNLFSRIGRDYYSSVGIFGGYTESLVIEHNEFTDLPYSGVSIGWGWTTQETSLKNNHVRFNRVHNVMNVMADGAGIYTLSKQPGTALFGNYIYNITRSPWAGEFNISAVYLDEGSSLILVSDNVMESVPLGIFFHKATENIVSDSRGTYQDLDSSDNLVIDNGATASDTIKAIAGIEAFYADIIVDGSES